MPRTGSGLDDGVVEFINRICDAPGGIGEDVVQDLGLKSGQIVEVISIVVQIVAMDT